MAGAWAGPCSTFIMTDWAWEPGEQAGRKDWCSLGGRGRRNLTGLKAWLCCDGAETGDDPVMELRGKVRQRYKMYYEVDP